MKKSFPSEQINQEAEALLNITQKLADIRKNLGIEDQDELSEIGLMQQSYKTPSEDSNQFEVDHNTFGKLIPNQQVEIEIFKQKTEQISPVNISAQKENFQQNSRQKQAKTQSISKITEDQQKRANEQIILLDDNAARAQELEFQFQAVEQKYKQVIAELQQKNTQLQVDVIHYSEQAEYNKLQYKQIEKKLSTHLKQLLVEIELIKEQNTQLEQKNKILIGQQKFPDKMKDYIENLESQLKDAQTELNSLANKYTKENNDLEIVKEEKKFMEKHIKKELEAQYKEEIRDLKFILEKWTSKEEMLRAIKKPKNLSTNLGESRKSQIEKENQKMKKQIDSLKDKLKTLESEQKKNQTSFLTEETLQNVFYKRIENYKISLKGYHLRCKIIQLLQKQVTQVQNFFNSTLRAFRKDLDSTKQQMLDDQKKVFITFENLITSIYEEFVKEKEILLDTVEHLKKQTKDYQKEIGQLKSRMKNYDFLLQ